MGTKQKVRIIVQGAGASALNFLKKAGEELELVDVVCYEKNVDVGGTVSAGHLRAVEAFGGW